MCYDVLAFAPPAGGDALAFAEDLRASESDGLLGPLDPEKEKRKQELARLLQGRDPYLRPYALDYKHIAQREGIQIAAAKERYRHIELNSPPDLHGPQVVLNDDGVWFTLPYLHNGTPPDDPVRRAWGHLEALRNAGLLAYDPQLGHMLNLQTDFTAVVRAYRDTIQALKKAARAGRAWWKFW